VGGELCAGDDAEEAEFFTVNQLPPLAFQSHREALRTVLKKMEEIKNEKSKFF